VHTPQQYSLDRSIVGLEQALDRPQRHHVWRWLVRYRLEAVAETLRGQPPADSDAWLAPREDGLVREREQLVRRIADLSAVVLDHPDPEPVRQQVQRLVADLDRHRRRLNGLVYDAVSLELGGSE
jgi:hypothetical protein